MKSDWFPSISATKEEAIRNGSLTYSSNGEPCPRGHISSIRVEDDKCCACLVEDRARQKYPVEAPLKSLKALEKQREEKELNDLIKDPWE